LRERGSELAALPFAARSIKLGIVLDRRSSQQTPRRPKPSISAGELARESARHSDQPKTRGRARTKQLIEKQ